MADERHETSTAQTQAVAALVAMAGSNSGSASEPVLGTHGGSAYSLCRHHGPDGKMIRLISLNFGICEGMLETRPWNTNYKAKFCKVLETLTCGYCPDFIFGCGVPQRGSDVIQKELTSRNLTMLPGTCMGYVSIENLRCGSAKVIMQGCHLRNPGCT